MVTIQSSKISVPVSVIASGFMIAKKGLTTITTTTMRVERSE
jgi:hypothetical protein